MPNMSALPVSSVPLKGGHLAPPGQGEINHFERQDEVGYQQVVFPGKKDQMEKVIATLQSKGFMPNELVAAEVNWFYS